jgi:hypothetical protein
MVAIPREVRSRQICEWAGLSPMSRCDLTQKGIVPADEGTGRGKGGDPTFAPHRLIQAVVFEWTRANALETRQTAFALSRFLDNYPDLLETATPDLCLAYTFGQEPWLCTARVTPAGGVCLEPIEPSETPRLANLVCRIGALVEMLRTLIERKVPLWQYVEEEDRRTGHPMETTREYIRRIAALEWPSEQAPVRKQTKEEVVERELVAVGD